MHKHIQELHQVHQLPTLKQANMSKFSQESSSKGNFVVHKSELGKSPMIISESVFLDAGQINQVSSLDQ